MAQYARPTSDTTVGDWTPPPLFEKVGGSTPNDATLIHGVGDDACVIALSPISEPQAGTVTLTVRARGNADLPDAALAVDVLSAGVVVASRVITSIPSTFTLIWIDLTSGERAAITDWASLAVRLSTTTLPADAIHYDDAPVLYGGDFVLYPVGGAM